MSIIKNIIVYPIKGLPGIELNTSMVLPEGLEHDRRLMLVDKDNNFISQRTFRQLVDFKIAFDDNQIKVQFQQDSIGIDSSQFSINKFSSTVWEHQVETVEINTNISSWFSEHLHENVKLVKLNPGASRIKNYSNREGSTKLSFADGYPILILGTASMDLLNSKLKESVSYSRFRPNILIQTMIPHEEDEWSSISFGESQLEIINPCARCQVVNINQETGEAFKEPLKTLATYRKYGNQINFAANASCLKTGVIRVGDRMGKA